MWKSSTPHLPNSVQAEERVLQRSSCGFSHSWNWFSGKTSPFASDNTWVLISDFFPPYTNPFLSEKYYPSRFFERNRWLNISCRSRLTIDRYQTFFRYMQNIIYTRDNSCTVSKSFEEARSARFTPGYRLKWPRFALRFLRAPRRDVACLRKVWQLFVPSQSSESNSLLSHEVIC